MNIFNHRAAHDETKQLLLHIHGLLHRILERDATIMSTLDDIKTKTTQVLAKAQANTNALAAIKTIIDGDKAMLVDLKAKLDAAVANGDQDAIDEASANLDQGLAALDAGAAAEAAMSGTDQAPAPATTDTGTTDTGTTGDTSTDQPDPNAPAPDAPAADASAADDSEQTF